METVGSLFSRLSAALCRGLIEALRLPEPALHGVLGFPRLYAAASLKPLGPVRGEGVQDRFPRLYAAASLKQRRARPPGARARPAFRGFMPRPH